MADLKVVTLERGTNSSGSSLATVRHCARGIFSVTRCVGTTRIASGFLCREIDLCVVVYSLHPWKEGNSGGSYIVILVTSPERLNKNKNSL